MAMQDVCPSIVDIAAAGLVVTRHGHGVAEGHKWIEQRGAWYYLMFPDGTYETFQRGFAGLGPILQDKPEIYEVMVKQYMAPEGNDGKA